MLPISIQLKHLGKKKVRTVDYALPPVRNLDELLTAVVHQEVARFNLKREEVLLMPFLTPGDIQEQSQAGKVGLGDIANRKLATVEDSIEVARQAFKDGLFIVFHNDEELRDLAAPITLTETSVLAFLRMMFLTGTYW
ncbi:hypothetical protein [Neolewinella antarctica]|uniref:Uncharacterized protein n=1 Tax=Neolewinella antarctica TaxID=442734 RepID=A0ABX0XFJ3_9BACT|nr:hypothetical protein [Neolewinella antarctica]NJC27512.1 hypothetical protein [Neolewinella antarctica]